MVIHESSNSLIVSAGKFLISVNISSGHENWNNRDLLNVGNNRMVVAQNIVWLFTPRSAFLVDAKSGALEQRIEKKFYVFGQEFFSFGPTLDLIGCITITDDYYEKKEYQIKVLTMSGSEVVSQELTDQYGYPIDIDQCSNIMSSNMSFVFLCQNSDQIVAYSYSLKTFIFKNYEINLNELFGETTRVCSNQIAMIPGKTDSWAIACDSGFFIFDFTDPAKVTRGELKITIVPETQVFGSMSHFYMVTALDGSVSIQAIKL